MKTCYLCNASIMDWEEGIVIKDGDQLLDAHEECQNNAWLEAKASNE